MLMQNLYLFITIVNKDDADEFSAFYVRENVAPIYSTLCDGATNSKTLSILGFEKSEKMLMQSIVTEGQVKKLKVDLTYEMDIDLPNRGIAVAIPLSSIASRALCEKIQSHEPKTPSEDEIKFFDERKLNMELIVSICPKGNSADIMKAAQGAGATGGTIVKAKGTAREGFDTFFGMSISDEKEIIYIVAKKEKRNAIMQAIASHNCGDENHHPLAFSLPVSDVAGLRLMKD